MKLLEKTSFYLRLQIIHLLDGSFFLHQTSYVKKLFKQFGMDKANLLSTPMMGQSRTSDDPYHLCEEEDDKFYGKTDYFAAVGAFLYLSTFTCPDISFTTSVLAQHSQKPTMRYRNGVKHVLCYLRGIEDLGLHYMKDGTPKVVGYVDAGFKSDETSSKS